MKRLSGCRRAGIARSVFSKVIPPALFCSATWIFSENTAQRKKCRLFNKVCMKKLKCWIALVGCWLVPMLTSGQNNLPFKVYIFPEFYSAETKAQLLKNNYAIAHVMIQAGFDKNRDDQVDEDVVKRYLNNF